MKGIILAGGSGTRLRPLTKLMNKHLLPVGKYPMICYAIVKLKEAGITDILIIMGKHSSGLYTDFLGSGLEWGVNLTYRIQDQAGGIAQALGLSEGFIAPGEKFVLVLGDNLLEDSLKDAAEQYEQQQEGAMVLLKQVDDPRRFGVPEIKDGRIIHIQEKPAEPKSDYAVTGIYFYDDSVFRAVAEIAPSARGELEITDVNNVYASQGQLTYSVLSGWWIDAGTHESLQEANRLLGNASLEGEESGQ